MLVSAAAAAGDNIPDRIPYHVEAFRLSWASTFALHRFQPAAPSSSSQQLPILFPPVLVSCHSLVRATT